MKLFRRLFISKEAKKVLSALKEADSELKNPSFHLIKKVLKNVILNQDRDFIETIKGGLAPKQWVYVNITNIAGNMLESGKYHLYRGVINTMGPGQDLLKLYDTAMDEIMKMRVVDSKQANTEKEALRKNMEQVG